ncbi:MAG: nucleoside permease, partial [Bacteroidales bacterium]|nr:nucleoside permease [Bacteroidales bacterium]
GAGLLVGNFLCARLIHHYKTIAGYDWNAIWGITTLASIILMIAFVLFFKTEKSLETT